MDILPSGSIFRELQDIHDTGYFSAQPSLEDHWQQVRPRRVVCSAPSAALGRIDASAGAPQDYSCVWIDRPPRGAEIAVCKHASRAAFRAEAPQDAVPAE